MAYTYEAAPTSGAPRSHPITDTLESRIQHLRHLERQHSFNAAVARRKEEVARTQYIAAHRKLERLKELTPAQKQADLDQTMTWCRTHYAEPPGTGVLRLEEALREIKIHSAQGRPNRVYHRYL